MDVEKQLLRAERWEAAQARAQAKATATPGASGTTGHPDRAHHGPAAGISAAACDLLRAAGTISDAFTGIALDMQTEGLVA
eukprot:3278305-Heterocapsa_arctica.AAC.1